MALTLRTVAGIQTPAIARAFLVPEPTIAQRLVRAKRTIRTARIPYQVPGPRSSRVAWHRCCWCSTSCSRRAIGNR